MKGKFMWSISGGIFSFQIDDEVSNIPLSHIAGIVFREPEGTLIVHSTSNKMKLFVRSGKPFTADLYDQLLKALEVRGSELQDEMVDEFVIPLANMALDESNESNVYGLCEKAKAFMEKNAGGVS